MHLAYLLLGTNLGDKERNIGLAETNIRNLGCRILSRSGIYSSSSWGYPSENLFLNRVVLAETSLSPHDLICALKKIEEKSGRVRAGGGYADRILDIDILFYDQLILKNEDLIIPHPRLHLRKFALVPLAEIARDLIHPVILMPVWKILESCPDQSEVFPL